MLLESFSLHQMTFSTSLYKFSPCLQFWSIYSSMAHITYSNFSLNTFHLSPVCFSTHTCSVALSQRMSLFLFYTFGFSIVFFIPFFLMGWVLVHITRLEKISPSDSFIEPNPIHLTCTPTEIQFWVKQRPACCGELIFEEFLGQRPQICLHRGINFTHRRAPLATAQLWPLGL